jgi:flavin-dependent thymidylate synthase
MKILLAGYNLDTDVIKDLTKSSPARADVTPETLSAAYARISRDPRSIDELRQVARQEVENSRKSNKAIIFKMGHHSVAEHAVFNFDIIGVSRLAMEEIEKFRLCSFTEKSQRYITLNDDFVIPVELKMSTHIREFSETVRLQFDFYKKCYEVLKEQVKQKHPQEAADPKKESLLDGWAKEDARYITPLATCGQVGETLNARNLELVIRRFASHPLKEVQELGRKMYNLVNIVAPSIIIFTDVNDYDQKTYPALKNLSHAMLSSQQIVPEAYPGDINLVEYSLHADDSLLAALIHTSSRVNYRQCLQAVRLMKPDQKKDFIRTACQHMQFYDATLREFEYPALTYELFVSSSCFAQLKRHRMATLTAQDYDPELGVVIPEAITEAGLDKEFKEVIDKTNQVYRRIYADFPHAAPYILTNAHKRRVLMKVNARELYHISRLREDEHSQWEIRKKTAKMCDQAKRAMPLTMTFIGAKDEFPKIFEQEFGHPPKVVLPK